MHTEDPDQPGHSDLDLLCLSIYSAVGSDPASRQRHRSACANVQADLCLHCLLVGSLDIISKGFCLALSVICDPIFLTPSSISFV